MEAGRTVRLRSLRGNHKVLLQKSQELRGRMAVEVLHHPVVVQYGQLACGEADCHEIVVLLSTSMCRIGFSLLCTYQSSGCSTMMAIGNIEMRHEGKPFGDGCYVLFLIYNPELMTEAIHRCDEVILRLLEGVTCHDGIQHIIIGISQEDGFDVGITHTHMLHAILFLVPACKLMLENHTVHIVIHGCSHHYAILSMSVHGLGIDVIMVVSILHEPTFTLKLGKVLCCTLIHTSIILAGAYGEVYLGLDDMVERLLVVASFCACFIRVKHVIWPAFHLLHQFTRWTQSFEGFYSCHYLFTWNLVTPSWIYATICRAAAIPALTLASAVCAPIFLGVVK